MITLNYYYKYQISMTLTIILFYLLRFKIKFLLKIFFYKKYI